MKKTLIILACALIAVAACKKDDETTSGDISLAFESNVATLNEGENFQIRMSQLKFNGTYNEKSDYDLEANPLGVKFSSSDVNIATVSASGLITAGSKSGSATIKAECSKAAVKGMFTVKVTAKAPEVHTFSQNLGQPLTKDMIVLPVGITHATMQGLDIDRNGNFYIAWEEGNNMYVRKFDASGKVVGNDMRLPASGHGDGFCIEQDKAEVYFWTVGSLGEPNGGYSGSNPNDSAVRLICRFKFEGGKTAYAEDAVESFYINDKGCRIVDLDTEHGVLACWGRDNAEFVKIYNSADIRNCKKVTKTVTRKEKHAAIVEAYDLNEVKTIGEIRWDRNVVCGRSADGSSMNAIQGFCVYDDKVYVEAGTKSDPYSTISVLDFNGKLLETRTPVGVSADKNALIKLNVSSDGTFEPEGCHIRNGAMYLGFVGDYNTAGAKKHACIIKLK